MKEISFVFPGQYGKRGVKDRYLPAIIELQDHICKCYGIGWPRRYVFTNEPKDRFCLTKFSTYFSRFIVRPMQKIFKYPNYYIYWSNVKLFDLLYCNKVAKDESKIIFTNPLLNKTIKKAKKAGKYVVVEAPNSEPIREYERIVCEYEKFNIHNRYIYGNPKFRDTWLNGYRMADKIITISKVSFTTYLQAGYDKKKFRLIPLTGTEFVSTNTGNENGKQKAFVSTAQHSFIKGTQRLLLAWKKAGIKDIPLYIIGEIGEDLKEFINKYGPFENVIYTGFKNNLSEFYEGIEGVGVLLSLSEGAVRTTPEMMAYGFPMVTTEDASCDLVQSGRNGFIVDVFDEEQIINILKYIDDNWNEVMQMKGNVISSLNRRTVSDYSKEVGLFLMKLIDSIGRKHIE